MTVDDLDRDEIAAHPECYRRPTYRKSRTVRISDYQTWLEACLEHDQDPECADILIDEGGGESTLIEYVGEYPEIKR